METLFSSSSDIWAKDNGETLEDHTNSCIAILKQFLSYKADAVRRISQKLNIDNRELASRLFATVYLHDIGKTAHGFQKYIRGGKKATPHSLLSLPFISAALTHINGMSFETIAVLSHHTPYYESLFEDYNGMLLDENKYIMPYAKDFYNLLPSKHEEILGYPFPFDLKTPFWEKSVAELKQFAIGDHLNKPSFTREILALFVGVLHTCDWLGSSKVINPKFFTELISAKIETELREKSQTKSKKWAGWKYFQLKATDVDNDIFIRIPTGQGKTEAALKWADKESKNIFYLLPTRVVSNHLYERLQKYFGDDVGLAHGTAILKLAEEKDWDEEIYRTDYLKASTGLKPIIVATVDQLLLSMLHFRHWEMLTLNASDSMIIFDEIHSYDLYTTALIFEAAKEFKNRGAKLCFMSATFPSYIEKGLKEILRQPPIIHEKSFDNLCRHNVKWSNHTIVSSIDEIIHLLNNGMRILIVLNTVPEAVNLYQCFIKKNVSKEKIKLFHSRFIERDRRTLENDIVKGSFSDGFIAITTQVIEVGIDIDYDFLYTQVAPLDALIQRMGRVNRKGEKNIDTPNVFIFDVKNSGSDWVYGKDNMERAKKICQNLNTVLLTEKNLRDLVEKQYPINKIYPSLICEQERVQANLQELRIYLWHLQTVRLQRGDEWLRRIATTRQKQENQLSIEVIPLLFKQNIERLSNKIEVINYHVRIPFWMAKGKLVFSENKIPFVNLKYDQEIGVIDPRESLK